MAFRLKVKVFSRVLVMLEQTGIEKKYNGIHVQKTENKNKLFTESKTNLSPSQKMAKHNQYAWPFCDNIFFLTL